MGTAFGNFLIVETKVLPLNIPTLTLNVIMMDLIVAETTPHPYLKQENKHLEGKTKCSSAIVTLPSPWGYILVHK